MIRVLFFITLFFGNNVFAGNDIIELTAESDINDIKKYVAASKAGPKPSCIQKKMMDLTNGKSQDELKKIRKEGMKYTKKFMIECACPFKQELIEATKTMKDVLEKHPDWNGKPVKYGSKYSMPKNPEKNAELINTLNNECS